MRPVAALAVLAAACVFPGVALAHGDPVGDALRRGNLFLPFDSKLPESKRQPLAAAVYDANRLGFAVRVAVVGSSYDLGAVRTLWRKPDGLARYVGADLRDDGVYRQRVLVVMPNGFGVFWAGHDTTPLRRVVRGIPTGRGLPALVAAARTAVVRLAEADGVRVTTADGRMSYARQRVIILGFVGVALGGGAAVRLALRRRQAA